MHRLKQRFAALALLLAGFLPLVFWLEDTAAEEITPLIVQVEREDIIGAVADYRAQYDPATTRGLIALRQIAIGVLRLGLRLDDPYERNAVAGVLGRWGDQAAIWVLDEALHSSNPMVRRTAADALGDMATPGAVATLRRFYYEGPKGRLLALSALRRTGDKTALLFYLDAVASADPGLRVLGIEGLGELRAGIARPRLRMLLQQEPNPLIRNNVACALALLGEQEGLGYLKERISDAREQVRDSAAGFLGFLSDPAVVPVLHTALHDTSESVRTTAAASLTRFKDPSGLPLVEQALTYPDFRIRLAAAISFSRMDYGTARPLIVKALASEDLFVRANALKVIGESRDRTASALVTETVNRETDPFVRAQGIWTLGQISGGEKIPLLLDFLTAEDKEVRHASAEALVTIGDRLLQAKRGGE